MAGYFHHMLAGIGMWAFKNGNEHLIQQALEHALKGRTSLVIAHRLSTITSADQIIVVDDGVVVEQGTHVELRSLGGLYDSLYEDLLRVDVTADQ